MKKLLNPILSGCLAVAVIATPVQTVAAAEGVRISSKVGIIEPADTTAHRVIRRHRRYHRRHIHPHRHHHRRYHRRHHHHHSPWPYIIGGIIIGGVIANSAAHVRWCEGRYRTYNRRTDTYISRPGVRRRCRSPYIH